MDPAIKWDCNHRVSCATVRLEHPSHLTSHQTSPGRQHRAPSGLIQPWPPEGDMVSKGARTLKRRPTPTEHNVLFLFCGSQWKLEQGLLPFGASPPGPTVRFFWVSATAAMPTPSLGGGRSSTTAVVLLEEASNMQGTLQKAGGSP